MRFSSETAPASVLKSRSAAPEPEQAYFADGLTEELISQLAQIRELRVTGRSSSFLFKERPEDLRAVGQKLGVAHIIEGSVRRSGARLRITAQRVACADGYYLWAETFDRELGEVFAIQEEVARAVTRALGVKLGAWPDHGGATSVEAFEHFLKAGRIWAQVDFGEIEGRIEHLRRAVDIDPDYAGLGEPLDPSRLSRLDASDATVGRRCGTRTCHGAGHGAPPEPAGGQCGGRLASRRQATVASGRRAHQLRSAAWLRERSQRRRYRGGLPHRHRPDPRGPSLPSGCARCRPAVPGRLDPADPQLRDPPDLARVRRRVPARAGPRGRPDGIGTAAAQASPPRGGGRPGGRSAV